MATLLKRAVGTLLIVGIIGISWRLNELHHELQRLQTDVHHLKQELQRLSQQQSDLRKQVEIDQYRIQAEKWRMLHPTPKPKRVAAQKRRVEWQTFKMSAYIARCKEGCTGKTATGYRLTSAKKDRVIAVDPKVIPLHSIVEIEGYGTFRALDTGGKIKGKKIDLFVDTTSYARKIGVRHVKLRILQHGKPKVS